MHPNQSHLNVRKNARTGNISHDVAASVVVFLVALPLCMGIAIASGVPVSAGLMTGIIAGLVVGTLGGVPLQVSGPAAGLTVIVYEAVQRYGLEMLGLIVFLAGVLQLIAGCLRLGQWFRAVSPAVVTGMLAGIGVLIFASQFHVMLDDVPKGSGIANLVSIPQAIGKALRTPDVAPRNVRHDRRQLLQELGELHRRQVILSEQIAERLPHHHTEGQRPPDVRLSDLVPEQERISQDLQPLLDRTLQVFAGKANRQDRASQSGNAALQALRQSQRDLAENRADVIASAQQSAVENLVALQGVFKNHELAAALGVVTILVLVFWKSLAIGRLKVVPAPLVAVIVATAIAGIWQLPVIYVEVPDSMIDEMHFLSRSMVADAPLMGILGSALLMAVIASAETLLSATAVDQMHSGPRTQYNRELIAHGFGNMLCGLVGALPMTGVIVRSSANVQAGARTRLSAILHGVWLLIFVVLLGTLLRMIPTSALAAILVYTGYKLVNWKAIKELAEFGVGEVVIYAATVAVIVVEDLLTGVLVGMALAVGKLVLRFTRLKIRIDATEQPRRIILRLDGMATFLKIPKLARALDQIPPQSTVDVDLDRLMHIDHACLQLLRTWVNQHESAGGKVHLDWQSLQHFARHGKLSHESAESYSSVA